MFGVMAIAYVFMFGLALFSDIGLHHNVVQSTRGDHKPFLDTVWTTQIMRGCLVFVMGCLIALGLWISGIYHWLPSSNAYADPSLPVILVVLSFTAVIASFESTKISASSRNLNVKKTKIIEFGSQLTGMMFMVFLAWWTRSVWAFVFSAMLSSVLKTILSHWVLDGVDNSFHWDKNEFKEIFSYGKWVFVSSVIGFLYMSMDKIIFGGIMTPKMFGLYAVTVLILNAFKDVFTKVNSGVFFPALSETYRENPENLRNIYYKYRVYSDMFLCFGAGLLYATAPIIIGILYDERYQAASSIFQILSIGIIGLRNDLTQQAFLAIGKPKLMTMIMSVNLVVLAILLPLSNRFFGIHSSLWVLALSSFFVTPLIMKYKKENHILSWRKEVYGLIFLPIGYAIGQVVVYFYHALDLPIPLRGSIAIL